MLRTSNSPRAATMSFPNSRLLPPQKAPIRVYKSDFSPFLCCFPPSPSKEKVALQGLLNLIYTTGLNINEQTSPDILRQIRAAMDMAINNLRTVGCHIDSTDEYGNSPLIVAADMHNLIAFQALLAAGADINAKTDKQKTVLMKAVSGFSDKPGALKLVNELLKFMPNLNINAKCHKGESALMKALKAMMFRNPGEADLVVAKALLEAGAKIDESILNYVQREWQGTMLDNLVQSYLTRNR